MRFVENIEPFRYTTQLKYKIGLASGVLNT